MLWQYPAFCVNRIPGKFQESFAKQSKNGFLRDLRQKMAFHMTDIKNKNCAMLLWVVPGPVERHVG